MQYLAQLIHFVIFLSKLTRF